MPAQRMPAFSKPAATLALCTAMITPQAALADDASQGTFPINKDADFSADVPAHLETVLSTAGLDLAAETARTDGDLVVLENAKFVDQAAPDSVIFVDEIGVVSHEEGIHTSIVATRDDGTIRGQFMDNSLAEDRFFLLDTNGAEINVATRDDDHFETSLQAENLIFSSGSYDAAFHGANEGPAYSALFDDFAFGFETAPRNLDVSLSGTGALINANAGAEPGPAGQGDPSSHTIAIEEFGVSLLNHGLDHQDTDMLFDLEALEAGGNIAFASHLTNLEIEEREGDSVAYSSVNESLAEISYSREGLSFDFDTRGIDADGSVTLGMIYAMMTGDQDGDPDLSLTADNTRFALRVPVLPTEEAQEFGIDLVLAQLSPSNDLWSMVDPGQSLVREPLDLALAIDGNARAAQHIVSAAAGAVAATFMGGAPEDHVLDALESLDIDITGHLQAIGARADLDAAMTFEAENFLPHLISTITMSGVENALSDLAETPFVEEHDAMGAAMMLESLTMPGDDDTRVMEFEGDSDGSATLNGNPM